MLGKIKHDIVVRYRGYNVFIPKGAECRRDWSATGCDEWYLTQRGHNVSVLIV